MEPQIVAIEDLDVSLEGMKYLDNTRDFIHEVKEGTVEGIHKVIGNIHGSTGFIKTWLEERNRLGLVKDIELAKTRARKLTDEVKFQTIHKIRVPTVPGLTGDLPGLSITNQEILSEFFGKVDEVIKSVDKDISRFISNTDTQKSFGRIDPKYLDIKKQLATNKSKYDTYLSRNQIMDSAEIQTIVGNNAGYLDMVDSLWKTNLTVNDKDMLKLIPKVDALSKKIDIVYTILKESKSPISKQALNNLIEIVELAGNYITMYSNAYYLHIQSMQTAVKIEAIYMKFKNK